MANRKQPERWESTLLAIVLALAGAPFLFDKLGALVRTSILSFPAVLSSAPLLLVVAGAMLVLAEQNTLTPDPGNQRRKEGQHEL
jgi:hypothetical protein